MKTTSATDHACVWLECDGAIPCPSPACQCKWCQMPCTVCGEQLNARGYFDSHLIGKDWFCHACWRDYDNDVIDVNKT